MRNQLGTANTGLELAAMIAGAELYVVEISLVCGLRSKNISFDDDDLHCVVFSAENFLDQSFSLSDCSPVLTPRVVQLSVMISSPGPAPPPSSPP